MFCPHCEGEGEDMSVIEHEYYCRLKGKPRKLNDINFNPYKAAEEANKKKGGS